MHRIVTALALPGLALAALASAPAARGAEALCASGESKVGDAVLSVSFSTPAPGKPLQPWTNIWFGDPKAPLRINAGFKPQGDLLGPATSLGAGYETLDLHAPIRSITETLVAVAPDGRTWRSSEHGLPAPHAPQGPEARSTTSNWLANRMDGFARLNEDLFDRFAAGEKLVIRREGDGGDVFATTQITPPTAVVQQRMYAEAMARARASQHPCGPPLSIPPAPIRMGVGSDPAEPPRLYLRPKDDGVIVSAPTLQDLGKVDPRLSSGKIVGQARVECRVGLAGRLQDCTARPGAVPEWLGPVSQFTAGRVTLAERLPDGRRTFGLGVVLSVTWEKRGVRHAIVAAEGLAIPDA